MKALLLLLTLILSIASASPATPSDIYPFEPLVSVSVEMDTPIGGIKYGEILALRCVVSGIEEPYYIQWQYSEDKEIWYEIPCNEDEYEFVLTEENAKWYYRVAVYKFD